MECGSYRGIKLLEHVMKVVERILEHRIWQQIEVGDMQFGFMKGKGTTDAIFTACRNNRIASAVLATAIPSVCLSVCPSVRLSVCHTPVLCQNDGM